MKGLDHSYNICLCRHPESADANTHAYSSSTHNSHAVEAARGLTTPEWIKKNVEYVHNGVLFSHEEE
jgi:hypothetical protein